MFLAFSLSLRMLFSKTQTVNGQLSVTVFLVQLQVQIYTLLSTYIVTYVDNETTKATLSIFNVLKNCVKNFHSRKNKKGRAFVNEKWKRESETEKVLMEVKQNRTGYHSSGLPVYKAEMTTCVPDRFICYHSPVGKSLWKLQKWLAYVNKVQQLMALLLGLLVSVLLTVS